MTQLSNYHGVKLNVDQLLFIIHGPLAEQLMPHYSSESQKMQVLMDILSFLFVL